MIKCIFSSCSTIFFFTNLFRFYFISVFLTLWLFYPHFISQILTRWKKEVCILLHMHFVHFELQIQFPSFPQYVAATVMGFTIAFHRSHLLLLAAYFFFISIYLSFRRNWIILKMFWFFFLLISSMHLTSFILNYLYFYNIFYLLVYLKILLVSQ